MGIMHSFWETPMAATALELKAAVKLLSTVMPVTFSRFWMAAGTPTAHTPATRLRSTLRRWRGFRLT